MTVQESASAAPLVLSLFGPLQVLVEGKPLTRVRSRKGLWLLALLTLRHGRPVERDWLAGTLWPDIDQSQAFANLRPILSELRRALGSSHGARLQSPTRHTLSLDLTGIEVDLLAFDAAIASKAPARLEQAVALYRGPLLEGCTEEWVFQEREAREQDCLRALQALADAAARAGEYEVAADHWRRAAALDPLGESARRGLMEALAKSGDINAALQVYREFIERLRGEMGAVPDAETTALYVHLREQVRQKATTSSAVPAREEEAVVPRVSGYLPHPLTELVGREDERLDVAERFQRARLVTLTGPGGIGKTRLAVAVAGEVVREYPDGVWLVPLEALPASSGGSGNDGSSEGTQAIVQQIASVLGVKGGNGHSLIEAVTDHLRRKRLLLVLDNCEHLVEPCATVVSHLLRECLGVRILATSRETLRVSGESAWSVPALAAPDPNHLPLGGSALARALSGYDAVQLFVERAEAVDKRFTLTSSNAREVALLCARLGGIPLALELAAARAGVLTPAQIMEQFDAHPLDALSSRQRDTVPRHRTLRATLEWSYGLLPPEAQTFLTDLGFFRGGWTLAAVQAVCPEADAVEMLATLQDASLINTTEEETGTRFSLLETVRQFALEELEKSGRAGEVQQRHARYYARWLQENYEGWSMLRGAEFQHFLVSAEREYANIRAALVWARESAETELLVELCSDLSGFWNHTSRIGEARDWFEIAARQVTQMGDAHPSLREIYRRVQMDFFHAIGDFEAAAQLQFEAFEDFRRAGNAVEGRTYLFYAAQFRTHSDLTWSLSMLEQQCLPLERAYSRDGRANASILSQLALVSRLAGHPERAASYLAEALDLCRGREESDSNGYLHALRVGGRAAINDGDLALALERFEKCLPVARRVGNTFAMAGSLCSLAELAHETGDREQEQKYLAEAITVAGGDPAVRLAQVLRHQRAELLLALGDRTGATALAVETLNLLRGKALSCRLHTYSLLLLLADGELTERPEPHRTERAARLVGVAAGIAVRLGLVAPERADRERAARLHAALLGLLGPERLAKEESTGAALDDAATLEFAIAAGR